MAVTEGTYSTAASDTLSYTVPSGSNRIGILFFCVEDDVTLPTSVTATIGGNSLTAVTGSPASVTPVPNDAVYAFYILDANLPATGAQTVTVTHTGGVNDQGLFLSMSIHSGAAQQAPGYTETNDDTNADAILTIGAFNYTDGALAVACCVDGTGGQRYTESASWVEKWDANGSGGDDGSAGASRLYSGSGSDTLVFTRAAAVNRICGSVLMLSPNISFVPNDDADIFVPPPMQGWYPDVTVFS